MFQASYGSGHANNDEQHKSMWMIKLPLVGFADLIAPGSAILVCLSQLLTQPAQLQPVCFVT